MLLLLHLLGDFSIMPHLNACKYLPGKFLALILASVYQAEIISSNSTLFKIMLQWLTNCTIKDSLLQNYRLFSPYLKHTISMHVSVLTQNYNAGNL